MAGGAQQAQLPSGEGARAPAANLCTLAGRSIIPEALIPADCWTCGQRSSLTGQTDGQLPAARPAGTGSCGWRTARSQQGCSALQEPAPSSVSKALRRQGENGAEVEPCLEWEFQPGAAHSDSFPSPSPLCSASVPG